MASVDPVPPARRHPGVLVAVLLVVGGLLLASGIGLAYVRDTVLDRNDFVDRGASTLAEPAVRTEIAEAATNALIQVTPELLAIRPLVLAAAEFAVDTDVVEDIVRLGLVELHGTLLATDDDTLAVRLADLLLIVNAQAAALAPELAEVIPAGATDAAVELASEQRFETVIELADAARLGAFLLPLGALAAFAVAVWCSARRRATLTAVGVVIAVVGGLLVVGQAIGRAAVAAASTTDVGAILWDAYVADLSTWGLVVFACGVALALGAASLLRPVDVPAIADRVRLLVVRPAESPLTWVVRTGVAILVGLWLLLDPLGAVGAVASLAGIGLLAAGVSEVVRVTTRPTETGDGVESAATRPPAVAMILGGMAVVALVALLGWSLIRGVGEEQPVATDPGCNGSVLLCERRLDQVAIAATHNSNSAADDGYLKANHTEGIIEQLDAGYRGLLIDSYYGLATSADFVVTDRAPPTPEEREDLIAEIGEPAVEAAEALRARQLEIGSERDVYLCHGLCEVGSTPMVPALSDVAAWLEDHPREVLVFFIEDSISPADTADAFERAGLVDLTLVQSIEEPFPTLIEMIDSGRRIFVMSENRSDGVDWYHEGFAFTQETPFSFPTADDFVCDENRGEPDSPLFLVNHFVTPPDITVAEDVNDPVRLRDRLDECIEERGLFPNLVAIDFFAQGEVVEVVDQLNGVSRD